MEKQNVIIREALEKQNLPVWYLKNILKCSESTVTRLMREELPEEEQIRIVKLIENQKESNEVKLWNIRKK